MKTFRKIFSVIIAIILIPTLLVIGAILWAYATGNTLKLPFGSPQQTSDNFLLNAEIHTVNVYADNSETDGEASAPAGVRGYIQVSKMDLGNMTPSQYQEFYQNVLKDSDYLWFTVLCPDNTGLFIPDCQDGAACFCRLNSIGRQEQVYGYMILSGDTWIYKEAE